jgi:hypothetical protein
MSRTAMTPAQAYKLSSRHPCAGPGGFVIVPLAR